MKARFRRISRSMRAVAGRPDRALALGIFLALFSSASAQAALATPEQKKAGTPDVYRLCPGEIPNVRAITSCGGRRPA